MFNPVYFSSLPYVRGMAGDHEVILDNGEIINVSRNTNLAKQLAHSLTIPLPRANSLADLVHSACDGSERATALLARMDWQVIQLTTDTLPTNV